MQNTAGQSGLWCLSALPPEAGAMGFLNSVQVNLIVWMMRLSKGVTEDWGAYRMRIWRAARAALHRAGVDRWSTVWLQRYWAYSGHRARGIHQQYPTISAKLDAFRDKAWWEEERRKRGGLTHVRHYPRLMQMESRMDRVCGGQWRAVAFDRDLWRATENKWIQKEDLPWASGRQPSLEMPK